MIYDVVIIGCGPAGAVCGYLLSKKGYNCLILEKNNKPQEKICGGAVPYKCIQLLQSIGITTDYIVNKGGVVIKGFQVYRYGITKNFNYTHEEYGIGTRRIILDELLRKYAISSGVEIKNGEQVNEINTVDGIYIINNYMAHRVIIASGARGLPRYNISGILKKQAFGISAQVSGETLFDISRFRFWYFNDINEDEYFWAFPIGENLWNIGIWCKKPTKNIKEKYNNNFSKYIKPNFENLHYVICPKGEFLGNNKTINMDDSNILAIGDAAGTNDINSGEGIYFAIKSAVDLCNNY